MPSNLRRLVADHAALHEDLPPNYLLPSDDTASDDLTQLTALLAGPQGTPYSQGLWRLHLKMPEDYPKSPPKATFRTRIWHPNVEESTGAVCVDTLKRDWKSNLTLKDVLITISCLLIYPNPDSALNSAAGALLQEDYDAFARQAKLMTSIHAPVPADSKDAVMKAKLKGEDAGTVIREQEDSRSIRSQKGTRVQSLTMKKKGIQQSDPGASSHPFPQSSKNQRTEDLDAHDDDDDDFYNTDDENENPATASKENDPSLSPAPVRFAPPSPRKNAHGKRPLSVLTMPMDPDPFAMEIEDDNIDGMTASEKNIAANSCQSHFPERDLSPQRKSPKLSVLNRGINGSGRVRDDLVKIFEDDSETLDFLPLDGKENHGSLAGPKGLGQATRKNPAHYPPTLLAPSACATAPSSSKISKPVPGSRKVSSSSLKKGKPRIGIRRL